MLEAVPRQGQACVALDVATFPDPTLPRPLEKLSGHVRENAGDPLPLMSGKVLNGGRVWSGTTPYLPPSLDFGVDNNEIWSGGQCCTIQSEFGVAPHYNRRLEWAQFNWSEWSGQLHLWCGASMRRGL